MSILHGLPHDPASIFALVLLVAVGALLYATSRPNKTDGDDKKVHH